MKKRNPGLVYLFCFLSGGIYFFYWLLSLVEEINNFREREVIKYRPLIIKFLVVFFCYILLFFFPFRSLSDIGQSPVLVAVYLLLLFGLALFWLVLIIGTIIKIGKEVEAIQFEMQFPKTINTDLLIVFMFLYLTAIPYLQSNINKITDVQPSPVKNSRKPLVISLVFLFTLLILISNVLFNIFGSSGLLSGKRNSVEVSRFDLPLNSNTEQPINIENPGEYQLWVDADLVYREGMNHTITLDIRKGDGLFMEKQYKPLEAPLQVRTVTKTINNKVQKKFSGRLDKIHFEEAGIYTFTFRTQFDEKLTELNKYQFYIR